MSQAMGTHQTLEEVEELGWWTSPTNKNMLTSKEDYNAFWRKINSTGLPPDGDDTNYALDQSRNWGYATSCLWLSVQNALNEDLKGLTIKGFDGRMSVTIDDDKVHYSTPEGRAGLKLVKHVRDNRNGHVLNTAAFTLLGLVIGVAALRVRESTQASVEWLLNQQIGTGNLNNLELNMDRGYWLLQFCVNLLKRGADLLSRGASQI